MATKNGIRITLDLTIGKETIPKLLKQKDPHESIAQLAVRNNPTGVLSDEHTKYVKHSITLTKCLNRSSNLSKNAYCLYQNIWLSSCQYPILKTELVGDNETFYMCHSTQDGL
eukprot:7237458-Ditylum_brightwellii.AAC.1